MCDKGQPVNEVRDGELVLVCNYCREEVKDKSTPIKPTGKSSKPSDKE